MSMISNEFSLKGKKILVTGATSGIGFELCKQIVNSGGDFIGLGRKTEILEEFIKEKALLNSSVINIDLSDKESIVAKISNVDEVDGFVHSAGIDANCLIQFYKGELYDKAYTVNVDSCNIILAHLLKKKLLKKHGSVVFVSSISGVLGAKGKGPYAISKAALNIMAKTYANELAKKTIRVNSVAPGMVKTKIAEKATDYYSEDMMKEDEKKYPLGYGEPIDVALPIVFLLSRASKWITGQVINLDGGRLSVI